MLTNCFLFGNYFVLDPCNLIYSVVIFIISVFLTIMILFEMVLHIISTVRDLISLLNGRIFPPQHFEGPASLFFLFPLYFPVGSFLSSIFEFWKDQ